MNGKNILGGGPFVQGIDAGDQGQPRAEVDIGGYISDSIYLSDMRNTINSTMLKNEKERGGENKARDVVIHNLIPGHGTAILLYTHPTIHHTVKAKSV